MTDNHLDISYKFHIQTLRAISVLLVFLYHLKIEFFSQGYLGVDIFFVISGYVITQSIYRDFLKTNKINLKFFYNKRLKRILPNLIFILSITYIVYLVFGPPEISLWNDYLSSILGVSNFYYLFSNKGYFYNIFDNPFAHTWSLGVEEQFYFIYPFLALIFLEYFRNKRLFKLFLIIIILLSLFFSFNFLTKNPDISFYFSPLRFWELGFGCLLFFVNKEKINKPYIAILSLIFLLIIIFTNLSENIIIKNLLSVFAAGVFIISYRKNIYIENSIFQYFGKISYSFYLWHLPIIFFTNIYISNEIYLIFLSFVLTLIFSSITYYFVESFFINSKKLYSIKAVVTLVFFIIPLLTFIFYIKYINQDLRYQVREKIYNINYLEKKYNWKQKVTFQNIFVGENEIHKYCNENSNNNSRNIRGLISKCLKEKNQNYLFFISGNSHTAQYVNTFNKIPSVQNLYFESTNIEKVPDKKLNNLTKYYNRIIYVTDINNLDKLNSILKSKFINSNKIDFLFFNSTPFLYNIEKPAYCISRKIDCFSNKKLDFQKRNLKTLNNKLSHLNKKFTNIHIFDSYRTLCPNERCLVYDKNQNKLLYMDKTHLSIDGSYELIENLRSFLNKKFNIKDL